jgi:hypothetical protein
MKQIKTFEGACKVKGVDPIKVLPKVTGYPKGHHKALIALAKLIIINDALNFVDNGNKAWKPDWNNYSEGKYYPWFYLDKPGFRLDGVGYVLHVFGCRLPPCISHTGTGRICRETI